MSVNNPSLVNGLLEGRIRMTAVVKTGETAENPLTVEFKRGGREGDEWVAGIFSGGKPYVRRSRRIALDFDILEGFYDMLYLLAAFTAPDKDVVFRIHSDGSGSSAVKEAYLVYYKPSGQGQRRDIAQVAF